MQDGDWLFFLLVLSTAVSQATSYYVATSGSDVNNGLSWAAPKSTIQAAVDLTSDGDSVLVFNGVYNTGGQKAQGADLTNRVCMTNTILLTSVNGPDVTFIEGSGAKRYTYNYDFGWLL